MEMLNYKDFENYSRLELSEKFKNEFTSKYFEENYTKDNWEKLIQIYDKFMDEIFKTNSPAKLYCEYLLKLEKIELINIEETSKEDLYNLSREELKDKFIKAFNNYNPTDYNKVNWDKILSIKEDFENNINSAIFPVELYYKTIDDINSISKKVEESYRDKLLYDYTAEEFKDRFNKEFNSKYIEYNYTDENWQKIIQIYEDFNNNILSTGYPFNLFTDSRFKLAQVEAKFVEKELSVGVQVASKLGDIAKYLGKSIKNIYNAIKFTFRIFALNFAATIITIFIHLILGTFIYSILPRFVNDFMLQSVIGGLLFIIFNVMIFLDQDDKDVFNEPKMQIFKHSCTIPFYAAIFLIFLLLPKYPVLEELFPVFYPQMWISAFTEEYVFSPMIALTINCTLSIIIYLFVKRRDEY